MGDFGDLVNIEEFGEKREIFDLERGDVAFYCKDCTEIVQTQRTSPKGYEFSCDICEGKNIAIGTEKGLKENYFRKKF
ncbi:hypothetical protein N9J72_01300 [Candidatus Gracilibacteria bacterium]|nr:hypothetical protein [Candidatus Gracilibacteria bacterium]